MLYCFSPSEINSEHEVFSMSSDFCLLEVMPCVAYWQAVFMSLEHGFILSWCCGTKRNSSVARLPRGLGQEQSRLGRDGSSNSLCIAFLSSKTEGQITCSQRNPQGHSREDGSREGSKRPSGVPSFLLMATTLEDCSISGKCWLCSCLPSSCLILAT